MQVITFTSKGKRIDITRDDLQQMAKFGTETSGRYPKGSGKGSTQTPEATAVKRKLSQDEAFHYYVKIKGSAFGKKSEAMLLNKKVGSAEGVAKAYRERAGKLPKGSKQADILLKKAGRLLGLAEVYASQRDSLIGKSPYKKMAKQELTEQDIIDMIESGEFDEQIMTDIASEAGFEL